MQIEIASVLSALTPNVNWGGLGQGTDLPRIALYRVSGSQSVSLDGCAGSVKSTVQIDIYAEHYPACDQLSGQVQEALVGYRGGPIWGAELVAIRDRPEEVGGKEIQRISLDFAVIYTA